MNIRRDDFVELSDREERMEAWQSIHSWQYHYCRHQQSLARVVFYAATANVATSLKKQPLNPHVCLWTGSIWTWLLPELFVGFLAFNGFPFRYISFL